MDLDTETINGATYSIGSLDTFKQLHIARRLAPIVGMLMPVLPQLLSEELGENGKPKIAPLEKAMIAIPMIAMVVRDMSDQDTEYVVNTCLDVVSLKQNIGKNEAGNENFVWVPIRKNGTLQFMNMKLDTLLLLTYAVINKHLVSFFPTAGLTGSGATAK